MTNRSKTEDVLEDELRLRLLRHGIDLDRHAMLNKYPAPPRRGAESPSRGVFGERNRPAAQRTR